MVRIGGLIALLALIMTACADGGSSTSEPPATTVSTPEQPAVSDPAGEPADPVESDLAAARERWSAAQLRDYHYTASVSADAPDGPSVCGLAGELHVQVIAGVVTEARDTGTGCVIDPAAPDRIPLTVEEWFERIEDAQSSTPTVEVDFALLGHPRGLYAETAGSFLELSMIEFAEGVAETPDADAQLARLDEARAQWATKDPGTYQMTVEIACFCPEEFRGPFVVLVEDGNVEDATFKGGPVMDGVASDYFTVDGLFDAIEALAFSDRLEVTYDRESGFPVLVDADPSLNIADEEVFITVTNFQPERDLELLATLRGALTAYGAAVDTAPDGALEEDGAVMCGAERVSLAEPVGYEGNAAARRCFIDAVDTGAAAVFVRTQPTVEGDPIVDVYRVEASGVVTLYIDATRDNFGSGRWETVTCTGIDIRDDIGTNYFLADGCS